MSSNTSIALKKSGNPGSQPTDLKYGELAINYADGLLFYKDSNDNISTIGGGGGSQTNSFATLNVDSTLITSSSNNDTLKILSGDGINLTSNTSDKSITISTSLTSNPGVAHESYTADGSSNSFNLGTQATSDSYVIASINGIVQDPSSYSVSGDTLIFDTTPSINDNIDLRTFYSYSSDIKTKYTNLSSSGSNQTVDIYNKSEYRTVKYLIQAVEGSNVHCTEVILTHNDTDVYKNEYGTMYTNESLITVSADIDTNNVYLVVTTYNSNTKIDLTKISITARTLT